MGKHVFLPNRLPFAGAFVERGLLAFAFIALLAYCASLLWLDTRTLGNFQPFLEDDLFYYFGIAWNFWDHGRFTFDGLSSTNGFHPLWGLLLTFLSGVGRLIGLEKSDFVKFALAANFSLILLSVHVAARFLSEQFRCSFRHGLLIALSATLALAPYLLNGMETAVTALVVLTLVRTAFSCPTQQTVQNPPVRFAATLKLGALAAALMLARVDSLFILLALAPFIWRRFGWRQAFAAGTFSVVLFLVFWLPVALGGGDFLPISSGVKLWWAEIMGITPANVISRAAGYLPHVPAIGGVTVISWAVCALVLQKRVPRAASHLPSAEIGAWILAMALAFLAHYIFVFSRQFWAHSWYFGSYYLLFVMLGLATLFNLPRIGRILGPISCASILLGSSLYYIEKHKWAHDTAQWGEAAWDVIDYIEENVPPGERVGVWSAGEIGYYSERPVTNLEGLVGDAELLRANQTFTLYDYLERYDIKYVIQWFPKYAFRDDRIECKGSPTSVMPSHLRPRLALLKMNCSHFQMVHKINLSGRLRGYTIYFFKRNR